MCIDTLGYYGPHILDICSIIFLYIYHIQSVLWYVGGSLCNRIINSILKNCWRVRRQTQIPFQNKIEPSYAMPSGHAQSVFFSTIYIYFFNSHLALIYAFVSIVTCYQRLKYKNHTVGQLFVGALLGLISAIFVVHHIEW